MDIFKKIRVRDKKKKKKNKVGEETEPHNLLFYTQRLFTLSIISKKGNDYQEL